MKVSIFRADFSSIPKNHTKLELTQKVFFPACNSAGNFPILTQSEFKLFEIYMNHPVHITLLCGLHQIFRLKNMILSKIEHLVILSDCLELLPSS